MEGFSAINGIAHDYFRSSCDILVGGYSSYIYEKWLQLICPRSKIPAICSIKFRPTCLRSFWNTAVRTFFKWYAAIFHYSLIIIYFQWASDMIYRNLWAWRVYSIVVVAGKAKAREILRKKSFKLSPSPTAPRGVLRFELDRGVLLEPQNPYPFFRVILAEKGTHFKGFFLKNRVHFSKILPFSGFSPKSLDCRWICKTYAEYCYRNLVTVRRLVQSPTLQSTSFCGVHSDLRGKGIRVSPAW